MWTCIGFFNKHDTEKQWTNRLSTSYTIVKEETDMQNFETMRTGKTGVAFGLIRSIDSARDVFVIPYEVDEVGEVPFPYLLGIKSRKETFECLIGEKIPYLQTEIEAKSAETVYIEVDEDHVSLQTGKNINMKLATVYTDKVDVGSNRIELVEKHSFAGLETPKEFWMQIDSYLAEAYVGSPKVYIIGDGAKWIKRGLDVLPNSEFILDRFHLFKYMTKICGKGSRKEVFASLETNDKARFEAYVGQMKEKYPHRIKQIVTGATYIENQWEYARASLLRSDIRSSTEAHVSHILSARLSSRPLGWSKKGAETIAKLRVLDDNNESIQAFVMKAYRGDNFNYFNGVETAKILSSVKVAARKQRKPYPYITYSPIPRTGIPGVEKRSNGWLQAIKHGGRRIL